MTAGGRSRVDILRGERDRETEKDTDSIRHTCTHDIGDDQPLCFPRVSSRVTNHLPSLTTILEQSAALNNRHADLSPFRLAHLFLAQR